MAINGIDAQGPLQPRPAAELLNKGADQPVEQSKAKRSADRVELSDRAKQMLKESMVEGASREEIIEAARRRLDAGELYAPEAFEKAAERLLDSGALDRVDVE